jgi:TRAP-type mannitol/chloroaromatic compound transport system substrate-binding protein
MPPQRDAKQASTKRGDMKRRQFITTGAIGGAAALGAASSFPAPAISQGRQQWTMVTSWPKNAPGVGVNAQRAADMITALSGGRLSVKLYAAGELVPPFEAFDAVVSGTADMLHATPYYWQGKSPVFHWFTGVPFGLNATEHAAWLYFGGGQQLWDEAYAPFGVKPLYAGSSGVQAGGWFVREVKSLADLRGRKFRIAGLGGAVMQKMGVNVVLTPPGEIFAALQSGAVDAAEWVGPWNDLAFGLHQIAKYYYLPAFHEGGPALEISVNKQKYDALPKDLQQIVAAAAQATATTTLADFNWHNAISLEPLVRDHGVQPRTWPDDVVAEMGRATKEVLADIAASSELAGKVHASFTNALEKSRAWSKWSDQAYLDIRERALGA